MNTAPLTRVIHRLATTTRRRSLLVALPGLGMARVLPAPMASLAAKGKRRKRKPKKKTFCQNGQTVRIRADKQKKRKLLNNGALAGACVVCPDLAPTADLAAAIVAALPGATLRLCPGTFAVTTALLIDKDLTLVGAGQEQTFLDGQGLTRVLQLSDSAVTLQALAVTRGAVTGDNGAGISITDGALTLRSVAVHGNTSTNLGGGIYNRRGALSLEAETRIFDNTADLGGGMFISLGAVTLQAGSTVTGNRADLGGGIFIQSGDLTLAGGSAVTGNTANQGAGINTQAGDVLLKSGSQVTGNTATVTGGGIVRQLLGGVAFEPGSTVANNLPDNCDPDFGARV